MLLTENHISDMLDVLKAIVFWAVDSYKMANLREFCILTTHTKELLGYEKLRKKSKFTGFCGLDGRLFGSGRSH